MKTFVVFDRKTGEILRTHVQTDSHSDAAEHISKTASPTAQSAVVEVLEIDELVPGESYRVDTNTKKLIKVAANKARGSGSAFVQQNVGQARSARREFVDARTNKKL